MRRTRVLLVLPVLVAGLSGCLSQPESANDNPNPRSEEIPSIPPPIPRTAEPVPSAPLTVDPPGPTRSP